MEPLKRLDFMGICWPARSWLKTWALGGGGARKVLENEKVVLEQKKCGKNVVFKIKKLVFGPGV